MGVSAKSPVKRAIGHVHRGSRVPIPGQPGGELSEPRTAPPRTESRRLLEQVRRLQRERAAQR